MKKNYKNIKEQTERIKSLFSEERLFGNLIKESTEEECIEILKNNYYVVPKSSDEGKAYSKNVEGCIKNPDSTYTLLGKVYKIISEDTGITSKVKITLKDGCQIHLNGSSNCNGINSHMVTGSIYQTDDEFTLRIQLAVRFSDDDSINNNLTGTYVSFGKVGYISMQGDIKAINVKLQPDKKVNITNLKFAGIHTGNGQRLPASDTLKTTTKHRWVDTSGGKPTWEELMEEFIYRTSSTVDLSTVLENIKWCHLSSGSTYKIKTT